MNTCVMKTCKKCGVEKSFTEFYAMQGMRDGYRNDCRSCHSAAAKARYDKATSVERARQWRKANPERHNAATKAYRDRNKSEIQFRNFCQRFGLSVTDGKWWWAERANGCSLCPATEKLHFDHNHKTNEPRGWLCQLCNQGLGMFSDDAERLERAAAYIRKHQ